MRKLIHDNSNDRWYRAGLWEYMLLANPDKEVGEKIMIEKEYFQDQYGGAIATKILPHITLANFLAKEQMEELLCRWMQNACNQYYSFPVALNNFSGFPPHAIFIRVQNPQPFYTLAGNLKAIDNLLHSNGCPPLRLVDKPHLTIARRLAEEVYNKAIRDYAQRSFYELFTLDTLVLLKRESKNKKWQHFTNIHLPAERALFN